MNSIAGKSVGITQKIEGYFDDMWAFIILRGSDDQAMQFLVSISAYVFKVGCAFAVLCFKSQTCSRDPVISFCCVGICLATEDNKARLDSTVPFNII